MSEVSLWSFSYERGTPALCQGCNMATGTTKKKIRAELDKSRHKKVCAQTLNPMPQALSLEPQALIPKP